ncbi:MAG: site-specific DNA-methyltransferase [Erysipelotrichaceae bacterium]|jgi:adenine-specific DNA-methyltransferase
MIKDILDNNETISAQDRELSVLKEHFPACFSKDGSFDLDRFKEYISDKVDVKNEGYELKFLGKNYAKLLASIDTTTVIKPDKEHNEKPENKDSENLYITGDNLDGLKHLLKSYAGKIKCIYIDPPYNTGSDGFVYNDCFDFTVDDLMTKLSISESQAQRVLDLTKRGSASHSAWLMFVYPRLQLARDLLSNDGVIFISIDDNEQANLKLICDDVFGEENFEGHVHWRRRHNQPNDRTKMIGLVAEHLLVFAKNSLKLKEYGVGKVGLTGVFSNPDNDPRGLWNSKPWKVGSDQSGSRYTIQAPDGRLLDEEWMGDQSTYEELLADNRIYFPDNGRGWPRKKIFKQEREEEGQCATNWWPHSQFGSNQDGTGRVEELFDGVKNIFSKPKPTDLVKGVLNVTTLDNDFLVLDFFSGSATTADAVMQLNAEDGGNRKFIMVQLPEIIEEGKPAYNAGYRTIDEIGRERIIRAAKKIKEENPDTTADLGFKHYVLEEPAGKQLDDIIDFDRNLNELIVTNNIVEEFGTDTVLTTWLVRDGYGFSPKVKAIVFGSYTGYHIDKHLYLIDKGLYHSGTEAIVTRFDTDSEFNPENVVLFGYSFTWTEMESLQTNLKRLNATEKNLRINFDIRY